MAAEVNEQTARGVVEALQRGDIDELLGLMAPELVWQCPGKNALAGSYDVNTVARFFAGLWELSGRTVKVELDDLLVSDEYVVWFLRVTATRDGRDLDVIIASPGNMSREGKVRDVWFLPSDQRAWDAFWS